MTEIRSHPSWIKTNEVAGEITASTEKASNWPLVVLFVRRPHHNLLLLVVHLAVLWAHGSKLTMRISMWVHGKQLSLRCTR